MRSNRLALTLVLALAGCAQSAPAPTAPAAIAPAAEDTVTATGTLAPTGFDGRALLAVVSAWTADDIDHVVLTLNPGGITATIAKADLGKQVQFTALKKNTSYSILAQAYNTSGTTAPIDNSATLASSCTTTFSTTTDTAVSIGAIALRLADKTFSGSGTTGLAVTPGVVTNPSAAEGIAVIIPPVVSGLVNLNAVAVDAANAVYYTASNGGTGYDVYKLPDGGTATSIAGNFTVARGLAVDGATVYVNDEASNVIYSITGGMKTVVRRDYSFTLYPGALALHAASGTLFTTSSGGPIINKTSTGGAVLGTLTGTYASPRGVAVDAAGVVYVADTGNNRIVKVSADNSTTTVFATGFTGPQGIAVGPTGNVYVADTGANRVVKLDAAGTSLGTLSGTYTSPIGVAVAANGSVYVAEQGTYDNATYKFVGGRITKVTP